MAADSKIEWTHHTFNAWRGCTKVSPGCAHCYADQLSKRNPGTLGVWGKDGQRVIAAEAAWQEPVRWAQWAAEGICWTCGGRGWVTTELKIRGKRQRGMCRRCRSSGTVGAPYRARVFCASLADVFEGPDTMPEAAWAHVEAARARLFDLIYRTPSLDWLLLTKRPENVMGAVFRAWDAGQVVLGGRPMLDDWWRNGKPPHNVWLGTSVEDAKRKSRVDDLRNTPAAVRFLSVEPLLENLGTLDLSGIHWVIVGGESGGQARSMHPDWARSIRDQCQTAGVAFFMKQWGEWWPFSQNAFRGAPVWSGAPQHYMYSGPAPAGKSESIYRIGKKAAGRLLDGQEWSEFPSTGSGQARAAAAEVV